MDTWAEAAFVGFVIGAGLVAIAWNVWAAGRDKGQEDCPDCRVMRERMRVIMHAASGKG